MAHTEKQAVALPFQSEKASCEWISGLELKPSYECNDEGLRFQVICDGK
jgi:hypothetical protein